MSQSVVSMSQPGTGRNFFSRCRPETEKPQRKTGTSRMSREVHVRICRGLVVKFHRSTWRKGTAKTVSGEDQGDERKRTTDEVSKIFGRRQNWGLSVPRISSWGSLLTARAASGIEVA